MRSYSGLLQTQNVLDFVRFLSAERSFTVWRTAFSALTHLRGVLYPDTLPPSATRQTCIDNYDRCVAAVCACGARGDVRPGDVA